MKLPTYALKEAISISTPNYNDPHVEFPSGTLVFPFWNPQWLPKHRKEELEAEAKNLTGWNSPKPDMVMCLIGPHWVPVLRSNICRRD